QWPPPPRSSRRGVRRSTRPRRRRLYRCHVDCFRGHPPPQPDPRYHVCERGGSDSERVRALAKAFAATRVDAWASGDIVLDMWEKFVMIASLAGMNCLMRGSVGDIMATEDGECLMLELLGECQAVAAASGYAARPQHREQCRAMLTDKGSDNSA